VCGGRGSEGVGQRGSLSGDVHISQEADEGEGTEFLVELPVGGDEIATYRLGYSDKGGIVKRDIMLQGDPECLLSQGHIQPMHRQAQCEDVAQDGLLTSIEQVPFLLDRIAQLIEQQLRDANFGFPAEVLF